MIMFINSKFQIGLLQKCVSMHSLTLIQSSKKPWWNQMKKEHVLSAALPQFQSQLKHSPAQHCLARKMWLYLIMHKVLAGCFLWVFTLLEEIQQPSPINVPKSTKKFAGVQALGRLQWFGVLQRRGVWVRIQHGDIHTTLMMLRTLRMNIFLHSSVCETQLGAHH